MSVIGKKCVTANRLWVVVHHVHCGVTVYVKVGIYRDTLINIRIFPISIEDSRGCMAVGMFCLCNQCLPQPKVASSNPAHGVYSIKIVTDLRQVGGFLLVFRFPPPVNSDRHDITEILLKVALNTITLILTQTTSHFNTLYLTYLHNLKYLELSKLWKYLWMNMHGFYYNT